VRAEDEADMVASLRTCWSGHFRGLAATAVTDPYGLLMSKHRRDPRRLGRKPASEPPADASAAPLPVAAPAPRPAPATEVTRPAAKPAPKPPAKPAAKPVAKPAPTPAAKPAPRPAPKPAPKPARPTRPASKQAARPTIANGYRPAGTAATYRGLHGTRAMLVVALVVSFVFLVWLAWVVWFHSTPGVRSQLVGYEFNGPNQAIATVEVKLDKDVKTADCVVQALAEDHSVVGEVHFVPVDGPNRVPVGTERQATAMNLVGCTTPDEDRPR